jgi:hypothetical protein
MPIETTAPPFTRANNGSRLKGKYADFFDRIRELKGGWVSLPLDEITGATPTLKQIRIHAAAASRGIRLNTTIQEGRLYARLNIVPTPAA